MKDKNIPTYTGQEFLKLMQPLDKKDEEDDAEDDDQNFIRKDEPQEEQENGEEKLTTQEEVHSSEEVHSLIDKLKKNKVFPKNNQLRSLSVETGGLEEKKTTSISTESVWDDRPEEIAAMASKGSNPVDSILFAHKKRQKKLHDKKEMARDALAAGAILAKGKSGTATQGIGFGVPQQGYVARLKNLKQDRSHEVNNPSGGAWR